MKSLINKNLKTKQFTEEANTQSKKLTLDCGTPCPRIINNQISKLAIEVICSESGSIVDAGHDVLCRLLAFVLNNKALPRWSPRTDILNILSNFVLGLKPNMKYHQAETVALFVMNRLDGYPNLKKEFSIEVCSAGALSFSKRKVSILSVWKRESSNRENTNSLAVKFLKCLSSQDSFKKNYEKIKKSMLSEANFRAQLASSTIAKESLRYSSKLSPKGLSQSLDLYFSNSESIFKCNNPSTTTSNQTGLTPKRIKIPVFAVTGEILEPCSQARALVMLHRGRAQIHSAEPFSIKLTSDFVSEANNTCLSLEFPANKAKVRVAKKEIKHSKVTQTPGSAARKTQAILSELKARWGSACVYCGFKTLRPEIEHIKPKSLGGTNALHNLTIACKPCNRAKGAQLIEEFLAKDTERLAFIVGKSRRFG